MTLQEAALNNAQWCDAFCRTHGIAGRFDTVAWSSPERTPPFYPDAVTLAPGCSADALLSQVDAGPGCSIKDSFADVDLAPSGFEILFAAEWVCQDGPGGTEPAPRWSALAGEDELERWEAACGGAPIPRPFFRRELLADPRIRVLARSDGGEIRGGAITNRSATVIGLSNLFDVDGDLVSLWSDAATAARAVWGRMPVVGYAGGEELDAAHRAGLASIGSLAVWVNSARRGAGGR